MQVLQPSWSPRQPPAVEGGRTRPLLLPVHCGAATRGFRAAGSDGEVSRTTVETGEEQRAKLKDAPRRRRRATPARGADAGRCAAHAQPQHNNVRRLAAASLRRAERLRHHQHVQRPHQQLHRAAEQVHARHGAGPLPTPAPPRPFLFVWAGNLGQQGSTPTGLLLLPRWRWRGPRAGTPPCPTAPRGSVGRGRARRGSRGWRRPPAEAARRACGAECGRRGGRRARRCCVHNVRTRPEYKKKLPTKQQRTDRHRRRVSRRRGGARRGVVVRLLRPRQRRLLLPAQGQLDVHTPRG